MNQETHNIQQPLWAKIVSNVFTPLLVPTYCLILAMWLSPLSQVPEDVRLWATFIILLLTGAIPMSAIMTLMRIGKVSDIDISNRSQRYIPVLFLTICYMLAAFYLYRSQAYDWLVMLYAAGAALCVVVLCTLHTIKISGHAGSMAIMTALMLYMCRTYPDDGYLLPWVCGTFVLSGVVCAARLRLKCHSPAEILTGYVLGLAMAMAFMYLGPKIIPLL